MTNLEACSPSKLLKINDLRAAYGGGGLGGMTCARRMGGVGGT